MNDIRIRIGTAAILSLAAFLNLTGAFVVFIWWLIFIPRLKAMPHISVMAGFAAMIGVVAAVLQITTGTGISYGIRMAVILLIAMWLWSEQRPGEFFSLGVWLFGCRWGFEMGMVAELCMQAFDALVCDLDRLRTAWALKGVKVGVRHLATAGMILVTGALARAKDTAELLAVRGYRYGGSFCPSFDTSSADIIGCAGAVIAGAIAIIPVSEFFILPW
ncbi:MAG: hypothetical protein OS112_07360 [Methanoregula sp.]|nr:MAG: hypothetical protein OS112_07360 [Methanoregula sp.]